MIELTDISGMKEILQKIPEYAQTKHSNDT